MTYLVLHLLEQLVDDWVGGDLLWEELLLLGVWVGLLLIEVLWLLELLLLLLRLLPWLLLLLLSLLVLLLHRLTPITVISHVLLLISIGWCIDKKLKRPFLRILPTTLLSLLIDPMKATCIVAGVEDLLIKVLEATAFKPHVAKELWLRAFPNVFDFLLVEIASVTCANRLSIT